MKELRLDKSPLELTESALASACVLGIEAEH